MKNYSPNHPAVRAWTPQQQRQKQHDLYMRRQQRRRKTIENIETHIGLGLLLWSFPVIAFLATTSTPWWVTLHVFLTSFISAIALMMGSWKNDNL